MSSSWWAVKVPLGRTMSSISKLWPMLSNSRTKIVKVAKCRTKCNTEQSRFFLSHLSLTGQWVYSCKLQDKIQHEPLLLFLLKCNMKPSKPKFASSWWDSGTLQKSTDITKPVQLQGNPRAHRSVSAPWKLKGVCRQRAWFVCAFCRHQHPKQGVTFFQKLKVAISCKKNVI
jgi:hypothetical protein